MHIRTNWIVLLDHVILNCMELLTSFKYYKEVVLLSWRSFLLTDLHSAVELCRDRPGTSRDKQGQGRDKQGKAGTNREIPIPPLLVPTCPCLSMLVPACHCLSLYFPVCPCLSLSVPVCLYICYTFMSTPADKYERQSKLP